MRKTFFSWRRPAAVATIIITGGLAAQAADTPRDPRKNVNDVTSPAYCGQCHKRIYREWSSSMMGRDLDNPVVYQFYTATNAQGKFDGLGFKGFMRMRGHPEENGDCADCHVPIQVIEAHEKGEGDVDLGKAMRLETRKDHGIACIFCHSVKEVRLKKGVDGRWNRRIFERVRLEKGVIHGPYPQAEDSPHDRFRVSKLYRGSEICGVCHLNQEKKVVSISTYADWKELYDAGKTDKTCQDCHMPLIPGKARAAEDAPLREGLRHHVFIGARDAEMRKKALRLELKGHIENGRLVVDTVVENVSAAHTVPASAPIRNVILKIDAVDENGRPLPWAGGKKGLLPPLAGMGNPKTGEKGPRDWAGLPGKMYAKVYRSPVIPKLGRPLVGVGGFAAEAEVFNTLLHYKKPDHARFVFQVPDGVKTVKVKARLVYRWAYKPLADHKGWNMPDLPMTEREITLNAGR